MDSDQNNLGMGINGAGSGGAAAPGNVRWNPTKEQIDMLESLYNQGIRTPSADQIQQITGRLKKIGHIEGKNVFYWFQNHKARQRQKQKQESLAFFNHPHHYLHHQPHHPLAFPPPPPPRCPNVVCGPHYLSPTELGFYPSRPKVVFPASTEEFKPRPPRISEKIFLVDSCGSTGFQSGVPVPSYDLPATTTSSNYKQKLDDHDTQETLPLFPLHPTGILQGDEATTCSVISSSSTVEEGCGDKSFYDFFSGQTSLTCHATHHYS